MQMEKTNTDKDEIQTCNQLIKELRSLYSVQVIFDPDEKKKELFFNFNFYFPLDIAKISTKADCIIFIYTWNVHFFVIFAAHVQYYI